MKKYLEMIRIKRPEGSNTQREFCNKFLRPICGKPDKWGNYIKRVGESALMFSSHHDTVHKSAGYQKLILNGDILKSDSNCLGADCTSGVWLMLEMIKANVPGVYVFHAAEEMGCIGSGHLVEEGEIWQGIEACIAFDRYGEESVVTHQCGLRTASDTFALSLADVLGIPSLRPDPNGVYTDSNEYRDVIPECTNLSVGYKGQHTPNETQDLYFLQLLRDRLLAADWDRLIIERDPSVQEFDNFLGYRSKGEYDEILDLVEGYPEAIADLLEQYGYTARDLAQEIGATPVNRWLA